MKLSTKGRYGLRALVDIAENCDLNPVSIQSISERQNLSQTYLEQLLRLLRNAGLIKSQRGANGGYVLAKPAEKISVGETIRALEGDLKAVVCTGENDSGCSQADLCATRFVWDRINDAIEKAVDGISIKELVDKSKELRSSENLDTSACNN